mmetsp:Transcript_58974/g.144274  ORF Transcript_58974/g.144274 Transcript_58974/m.144274 type:complete len:587 (+) Transcript_58974:76-1836(+)
MLALYRLLLYSVSTMIVRSLSRLVLWLRIRTYQQRQQHQHSQHQQRNNFRLLADRDKQRHPYHQLRMTTSRKKLSLSILVGVFIVVATLLRITPRRRHHQQQQFLVPSSSSSTATATASNTTVFPPTHHHHDHGRRDSEDEEDDMPIMQLLSSYLLNPMTAANKNDNEFNEFGKTDLVVRLPPPIVGVEGRGGGVEVVDAVFAMALGSTIKDVIMFVTSLQRTGFVGDVALGVLPNSHRDMSEELWDYLLSVNEDSNEGDGKKKKKMMNVIVYTLSLYVNPRQTKSYRHGHSFYYNTTSQKYVGDARPFYRTFSQLRYEYYAAWLLSLHHDHQHKKQQHLQKYGRIMLTDLRDVYFQKNPFNMLPSHTEMKNTMMVFEEYPTKIIDQRSNRKWIRTARGRNVLKQIGHNNNVSCSGTTIGGYNAIATYLTHMIESFDESPQCNHLTGCDQGHHNFLVYSGRLTNNTTTDATQRMQRSLLPTPISKIIIGKQGYSIVNTLGLLAKHEDIHHKGEQIITPLRSLGIIDNETDQILNWDGTISPVFHQYDRDQELTLIMNRRGEKLVRQWKESRKNNTRNSTSTTTKAT